LDGRCVVITGASRGLGSALAERATELGAAVAGCSRSRPDESLAFGAMVDVNDHRAVTEFAASVVQRLGSIELWINNAAVIDPVGPLRDRTPDDVSRILGTNVAGVWNGTSAFVRDRRAQGGGGVLVNISSGVSLRASAGTGLYSASKAAVDRLTEATALEEADHGIDAWAIHPGVVDTAMQTSLRTADPADFPRAAEFQQLADLDAFNSGPYVADWVFAIAFDPRFRPPSVVWRLPDEQTRPSAPGLRPVEAGPTR
jgi:NAD(P)-dependent dehydrogenase (short-subunit alcohol dehydrogenase family)